MSLAGTRFPGISRRFLCVSCGARPDVYLGKPLRKQPFLGPKPSHLFFAKDVRCRLPRRSENAYTGRMEHLRFAPDKLYLIMRPNPLRLVRSTPRRVSTHREYL